MSEQAKAQLTNASLSPAPAQDGMLLRKCACGTHTIAGDKCHECKNKKGVLQRKSSNRSEISEAPPIVYEVLSSSGQPLDKSTRAFFESRFAHNFSKVPVSSAPQQMSYSSLTVGEPTSVFEQEADRVADSVMLNGKQENKASSTNQHQGEEFDLSKVRVHTDTRAAKSASAINSLAYTVGNNIVFGAGQFAPWTQKGRRLIAHELTHVIQQTVRRGADAIPGIQRVVEVRPPGRGEASAFDRRQELIDRMNRLSAAIQYRLNGRRIEYDLINEPSLTNFDRRIRAFIDRGEVVPMRLITRAGRVTNDGVNFQPLLIDSFVEGYVDLDDMLASDDLSFQLNLVHILTERFRVRNYEQRIGTNISDAEFDRAHAAGIESETELLRNAIGDPTIRFNFEETRPNGTLVFAFRSQAEGYRVFHVFRRGAAQQRGGEIFVQTRDRRRLTIQQLIAERAAAPAAP